MSNGYKDWLKEQQEDNKRIIAYVRNNGETSLTDNGIVQLHMYYSDSDYIDIEKFLDWLEKIGIYKRI